MNPHTCGDVLRSLGEVQHRREVLQIDRHAQEMANAAFMGPGQYPWKIIDQLGKINMTMRINQHDKEYLIRKKVLATGYGWQRSVDRCRQQVL